MVKTVEIGQEDDQMINQMEAARRVMASPMDLVNDALAIAACEVLIAHGTDHERASARDLLVLIEGETR